MMDGWMEIMEYSFGEKNLNLREDRETYWLKLFGKL